MQNFKVKGQASKEKAAIVLWYVTSPKKGIIAIHGLLVKLIKVGSASKCAVTWLVSPSPPAPSSL